MTTDIETVLAKNQKWMTPIEQTMGQGIARFYRRLGAKGQKLENALHGTWLGHPLHPVLTDVPLGAWTAAIALDAIDAIQGEDRYAAGAAAAIGVGLVGAAGSAMTGLTDWHKTDGAARRLGLVHGLLNIGATSLFAASWILRRARKRKPAQVCSLAGYLIGGVSAYLGGSLVYAERVGVDHAERKALTGGFVPVLPEAELPENTLRRVEVQGVRVLLVRRSGKIYALGEVCAHQGGPLADGRLEDDSVRCPWHGSCFALKDGRVLDGPSTYPQPCFDVRVTNGQIEVGPPGTQAAIQGYR